ncbi:MAG: hypothetical protein IH941_09185 [Acidobacteria bacterium]|nr:hypothetical protein [Acidobacteriota bacterium]
MRVPVLVVSGSIGSGKTTLLGELADLLIEAGEAFAAIEVDAFTQVFPRPKSDPYAMELAVRNLAAVWTNAASAGARRLVLASVIETSADLDALLGAVPGADPFVVRLAVDDAALLARVRRRELGTALAWHLDRSIELARILEAAAVEDVVVESDERAIRQIALEILQAAEWPVPH